MSPIHRSSSPALPALAVAAILALAFAGGAEASEPYTFTLLLEGSIGGPLQESSGSNTGFDNSGFQFGFAVLGAGDVQIGGRVGSLDFDEGLGGVGDASLDYVHAGGEYRFREGFYDSGVYFGLGYYELEGLGAGGAVETQNSVGLVVGVTGEFELTNRIGLMLEVTGHITDLDAAELFATAHAGLAIHF